MSDGMERHEHEALVHAHPHYHVTHNWNEERQAFEHLGSLHEHDHDHAALQHAHLPHRDFDSEHRGEAHVHDHEEAVKGRLPAQEAARGPEAAAKTAASTAKAKSGAKKTVAKKATTKKASAPARSNDAERR